MYMEMRLISPKLAHIYVHCKLQDFSLRGTITQIVP